MLLFHQETNNKCYYSIKKKEMHPPFTLSLEAIRIKTEHHQEVPSQSSPMLTLPIYSIV